MKTNTTDLVDKTVVLTQNGTIADERKRLRVTYGPSFYQPTGLYVKKDDEITVTLHETDQTVLPHLVISKPIVEDYKEAAKKGEELKVGVNTFKAAEEGILYLINESEETKIPAEVTIKGARVLPTFELGKTTVSEWEQILTQHSDAPAFELLTSKVIITSGMNFAELVLNPIKLLETHDEIVEIQAKLSGLTPDGPAIHQPTKFRYHFRHTRQEGYYMYASMNHTAYSDEGMPHVLDVNKLINDGWGPWHELGHLHQQTAWTTEDLVEVTVNLFSMTVQQQYGLPSRLELDGIYEKAFEYLESREKDFEKVEVWERLVMLWQLRLAYGDTLYPTVFKIVRETPIEDLPTEADDKLQKVMVWTSKAAKQNLIPFYEKWGVEITPETRQQILDLGYPEVTEEIWKLRDGKTE